MTNAGERYAAACGPARRARVFAFLALAIPIAVCSVSAADAGLYHYPWCETIRDRCYAKAKVRKAECNWRYNEAKNHQLNGLSKWPTGVANYCHMVPADR